MTVSMILKGSNSIGERKATHTKNDTGTAILHRQIYHEPINVVASSGNYLQLEDGRKILDATGGAAVSVIGHGNRRVKEAMLRQMDEVSYCHSLFFGSRSGEALGRALIDSTGGKMARAFIVSSGEIPSP
jgi:adenosylmethionine-8-amino-7-oxononanoate aminotransferase